MNRSRDIRSRWIILALFFGGFGLWSVTAPLTVPSSPSKVKFRAIAKSVQHLEGGIVREMKVKEGDHVKQGDVLIVLDDTQKPFRVRRLSQQRDVLRATEARLKAELDRRRRSPSSEHCPAVERARGENRLDGADAAI